jgi:hypothetical protein
LFFPKIQFWKVFNFSLREEKFQIFSFFPRDGAATIIQLWFHFNNDISFFFQILSTNSKYSDPHHFKAGPVPASLTEFIWFCLRRFRSSARNEIRTKAYQRFFLIIFFGWCHKTFNYMKMMATKLWKSFSNTYITKLFSKTSRSIISLFCT